MLEATDEGQQREQYLLSQNDNKILVPKVQINYIETMAIDNSES